MDGPTAPALFNNTTNDIEAFSPAVDKLLTSLYIIVTTFGILGNGVVLYVYIAKIIKRTPFLMLLLNLSISDIIMDISVYPYLFIDPSQYHDAPRAIQSLVCALVAKQTPGWIAVIANFFTLIYISFVRLTSFNPHSRTKNTILKERNVKIMIACSWLPGAALFAPYLFLFSISNTSHLCEFASDKYFVTANVLIFMLFWVACIGILSVNFFKTIMHIKKAKASLKDSALAQNRNQLTLMLLALPSTLVLLTIPVMVYLGLRAIAYSKFTDDMAGKMERRKIFKPSMLIGLLNTIADPLLYALTWRSFREGFCQNIPRISKENNNQSLKKCRSETIIDTDL